MPLGRERGVLCLVTDRRALAADNLPSATDRLVDLVTAAAAAGVDLVQIRERDLEGGALAELAGHCRERTRGAETRVLVNDRVDVAVAAGLDGAHLRSDSFAAAHARTLMEPGALLGRSIHTAAAAAQAARDGGLDYLVLGTIFASPSKGPSHPVIGVAELTAACRAVSLPVLAIGGMTLDRAEAAATAGAAGIAGIRWFVPPPGVSAEVHLRRLVADVRRVFDTCGTLS